MTITDLENLASVSVQDYIREHETADVQKLVLINKEICGVPFGLVADQILVRKKIAYKVPSFYSSKGVVYPPSVNLEQSSSEATARFKVQLLSKELGKNKFQSISDLTGGFGVDSFFFSKASDYLDFVEPHQSLLNIVSHNFKTLGVQNVQFHNMTAENFLNSASKKFDFVFVDPSRRDLQSKKVFRLVDCQPDVQNVLPKLFNRTEFVLIKVSPLLDIHQGLRELIHVKKVFVVSVGNECKELLFLLQKGFTGETLIETYNLNQLGEANRIFTFMFSEEQNSVAHLGEPELYLYEPNASILKSGAFKFVGEKYGVKKLHPNTHLYTATEKLDFPGRVFKIEDLHFNPKNLLSKKANVVTRNYPLKAEELKKKLKLEDGGENYVIAFTGIKKKHIVLATRME